MGGERCNLSKGERGVGRCRMREEGFSLSESVRAIARQLKCFGREQQAKQGFVGRIFRVIVFRKLFGARWVEGDRRTGRVDAQ